MGTQYGAIVHGRRVDTDVASTVEARSVAGAQGLNPHAHAQMLESRWLEMVGLIDDGG